MKLLEEGLVREVRARKDAPVWRRDEDTGQAFSLRLTAAGLKAIAAKSGAAVDEIARRRRGTRTPRARRQGRSGRTRATPPSRPADAGPRRPSGQGFAPHASRRDEDRRTSSRCWGGRRGRRSTRLSPRRDGCRTRTRGADRTAQARICARLGSLGPDAGNGLSDRARRGGRSAATTPSRSDVRRQGASHDAADSVPPAPMKRSRPKRLEPRGRVAEPPPGPAGRREMRNGGSGKPRAGEGRSLFELVRTAQAIEAPTPDGPAQARREPAGPRPERASPAVAQPSGRDSSRPFACLAADAGSGLPSSGRCVGRSRSGDAAQAESCAGEGEGRGCRRALRQPVGRRRARASI